MQRNAVPPAPAVRLLELLSRAGHAAYLVGGCVRDILLGRVPHDWDMATSARPEEIIGCLPPDARVIPVGLQHGTVSVVLDGMQMEVTTFRVDGSYSDTRRPDSVVFTQDVYADLARRDFTVNAMAYRPGQDLIDPFGGENDAYAGCIRCVGEPDVRFGEDALRILRALRFRAQLGFEIHPDTDRSLRRHCALLKKISAERIAQEMDRLLCGSYAAEVLRDYGDVFEVFLPERFRSGEKREDGISERVLRMIEQSSPIREVRLAALLYGLENVRDILKRLRCDRVTTDLVCMLVQSCDTPVLPQERDVWRQLAHLGERPLRLLLELQKGDCAEDSVRIQELDAAETLIEQIKASGACLGLRDLSLNGNDLLSLGVPAGPQIGRILSRLLARVIDGEIPNTRCALLEEAAALMEKENYFDRG